MNGAEIVTSPNIEELASQIHELPAEEKAQLIGKILGERPGISVVFGNGQVTRADLVVQINNAGKDILEGITQAIAKRIER